VKHVLGYHIPPAVTYAAIAAIVLAVVAAMWLMNPAREDRAAERQEHAGFRRWQNEHRNRVYRSDDRDGRH
jgi:hypothetical protein